MIKNKTNGKIYVGQTTGPIEERFKKHQKRSSNCRLISRAIQKNGWENFEKDWYECPDEDLNFDEELLVREMKTLAPEGYNLREGGGSNGKHSEETKQKISEANLGDKCYWYGKTLSDETKRKMSEARKGEKNYMYGKTMNEITKQKISEAKIGKPMSEDVKQKISESTTGENNHAAKRVYQYALEGTLLGSFGSCEEAGRYFKKNNGTNISICAGDKTGRHKTAYGFKWSYTFPFI